MQDRVSDVAAALGVKLYVKFVMLKYASIVGLSSILETVAPYKMQNSRSM